MTPTGNGQKSPLVNVQRAIRKFFRCKTPSPSGRHSPLVDPRSALSRLETKHVHFFFARHRDGGIIKIMIAEGSPFSIGSSLWQDGPAAAAPRAWGPSGLAGRLGSIGQDSATATGRVLTRTLGEYLTGGEPGIIFITD